MENTELIGKFYASNKITDTADSDKKTFLGDDYVNIILDSGATECLPKKVVEIVITDEKSDLTQAQNKLFSVIVPQVLSILADYDISVQDTQALLGRIDMSLRDNVKRGIAKMFGKDDDQMITLMQIQEILMKK